MKKLLLAALLCVSASAQIDFSTQPSTKPFTQRADFPGRCSFGQMLQRTDQAAGSNVYECGNNNDWNLSTGAGSVSGSGGSLCSATGGATNTLVSACSPAPSAYAAGMSVYLKVDACPMTPGPTTINLNSSGGEKRLPERSSAECGRVRS